MIVIGVTGYINSGKNTATRLLANRFGFKEYAFADALREMAMAVDPVISLHGAPDAVLYLLNEADGKMWLQQGGFRYSDLVLKIGYDNAKLIPDFRRFLQRLGTDGVRGTFGAEAWVNALGLRVVNDGCPPRICISDVRFLSEANWVRCQRGVIWRMVRPGVGGNDPHPSEVEMQSIEVDRTITASTLEELENGVIQAFNTMMR